MIRRRLDKALVIRLLNAAAVTELNDETPPADVLQTVFDAAYLCQGLEIWDRALVYVGLLEMLEMSGCPIPFVTEELFFDPLFREIARGRPVEELADEEQVPAPPLPWDEPDPVPDKISIAPGKSKRRKVGKT